MAESRPSMVTEAANEGLMAWILKRLKAKIPFDENKLYASEILAILLQNADGETRSLCQCIHYIKVDESFCITFKTLVIE